MQSCRSDGGSWSAVRVCKPAFGYSSLGLRSDMNPHDARGLRACAGVPGRACRVPTLARLRPDWCSCCAGRHLVLSLHGGLGLHQGRHNRAVPDRATLAARDQLGMRKFTWLCFKACRFALVSHTLPRVFSPAACGHGDSTDGLGCIARAAWAGFRVLELLAG